MTKVFPAFNPHFMAGLTLAALLGLVATALASLPLLQNMHIHALIIAMVIGLVYANTLRRFMPQSWGAGIHFSARKILRLAIVLYGFRLTFQDIADVGLSGIVISFLMVGLTFLLGYIVGTRVLKLDKDITILTSAGAAICGAAAVLANTSPNNQTAPISFSCALNSAILR